MPYEWNNKIVVTKEELIPDFFPSWDALRRRLDRDAKKPSGIRRARPGKGSGCEVLIDFDTLPLSIRSCMRDPRKVDCILEKFFSVDAGAVRYFAQKRTGRYGYIDPERQKEYVLDASVLSSALRLRAAHLYEVHLRRGKEKNTDRYLSAEVNLFNEFRRLKNLPQHTLPTHPGRFRDKLRRFEEAGYESLLRGYDNRNALKKTDRIKSLLNAMYIQKEKPSQVEVFRLYDAFLRGEVEVVNPDTGETYAPSDYGKLSVGSVTSFLSSWRERVATHLKRSSDRQQYMSRYEPFQKLEHPRYAGSILSIDDRQPPFVYDRNGSRVWLYMGIDLGSECYVGFVWGKEKNASFLLDFYREVVRNCAEWNLPVPAQLECESHLNSSLRDTLLQAGNLFEYVDIYPNSAHSKRIERYFRELRYDPRYEKGMDGWRGRPFARDEANRTGEESRKIIPFDLIVQQCLKEIENWNNSPCSIYPDKTRWEVFCEKQHPDVKPINWHGLLPHLGEWTATSCHRGQIRLNSDTFLLGDGGEIATGEALLSLMSLVEGKAIDVCWLRGHRGQVLKALIYLDGRCICEALAQPVAYRSRLEARANPDAAKNMELVERYKNTVRGWAQRHKNEIEQVTLIDKRVRTLNDKFKIGWMHDLPVYDGIDEAEEGGPEESGKAFHCDLNAVETYRIPSLMERFAGQDA